MKKIILLLALGCTSLYSQSYQWATDAGATNVDVSNEVKTDGSGNVISVGTFSGTVDFDPGVGVTNLICPGTVPNGYILKQTATGVFVWVKGFLGTGVCNVKSITTDISGSVYVTGAFNGVIDFDPGVASYTLATSSGTDEDAFICKLTSAGVFVWANRIGGIYDDDGKSIALDGSNNVFVAGDCSANGGVLAIDLNPGAGVNNFTFYAIDAFVLKMDNNGNYVAADTYGAGGTDYVYNLKVDASNNVYIGGFYSNNVISLAIGTAATASSGYVAKLSNSLVKIWAIIYSGGVSNNGDAYVQDLGVDGLGNVYTTGNFTGTMDFNGAVTSFSITSPGTTDNDVFVVKLNSTGGVTWCNKIASGIGAAFSTGLSLDPLNNVFVTGYFTGTVDFNPTGAVFAKSSAGGNDIFFCRLDANGVFGNDAQTYGGVGADIALGIQANGVGNYYLTGYYSGTFDFNAATATNTLTSAGNFDAFVAKYIQCTVPPLTTSSTPTLISVCANTQTALIVNAASGVTFNWFNIAGGGTTQGTGTTYTTPVITGTTSFWAEGTNTCAATARTQFSINVTASPTVNISASTSTVCSGLTTTLTASGASTYTWSTGATTTVVAVSPTVTTAYTATGTAVSGCKDTQTISITVSANPTVNITASSSTLCSGNTSTLTASGATTYTWSTGGTGTSITVSPTVNTVYTATGTAAGSCKDTQTLSITVSANPTVNITASSSTLCSGSSRTLTASGATTYSWSTGATGTSIVVAPNVNTVYTATGTSVAGCKNTQTLSLTVTTTPTLSTTNYTICAGGTATLTASGATTYSWNTGASTSSILVTPVSNTSYTVIGSNGACTDVNTVSVTVGTALSIAVTPSAPAICIGTSGTLTASGATSYTWNTGSNAASIVVSPTVNTTYTINGTSGVCAGSKTITMLVNANPTVSASSSSSIICTGSNATLSATGAANYTWNPGGLTGTSVAVSPTTTTVYNVIGATAAGCTDTKTISVTVSLCTAINENQNQTKLMSVYPNPNNGEFTISGSPKGVYAIVNSIGQTISTFEVKEELQNVNMSNLAEGMYYIIGNNIKTKIIVSK